MDAYTIPEAARAAGLSPREVRMRIEEGDLRAFIRAGRRMVEHSELARLVERRMPETPALRAAPPPKPSPHVVEDLVARLEEQALELARVRRTAAETRARDARELRRLEQELGDARRRIVELESTQKRPALSELFQSTEPAPG
jgi:hypothetical protein